MEELQSIFELIRSHKKETLFITLFLLTLYAISSIMTYFSQEYITLKMFDSYPIVSNSLSFPYTKKTSYSDSVSFSSMALEPIFDMNATVSTIKNFTDTASKINSISSGEGTLVVPKNASGFSINGIRFYSWGKKSKLFFNQIEQIEIEVVWIIDDVAISGKIGAGWNFLTEITVYELS